MPVYFRLCCYIYLNQNIARDRHMRVNSVVVIITFRAFEPGFELSPISCSLSYCVLKCGVIWLPYSYCACSSNLFKEHFARLTQRNIRKTRNTFSRSTRIRLMVTKFMDHDNYELGGRAQEAFPKLTLHLPFLAIIASSLA